MIFLLERFFAVAWMLNDDNPDLSMLELLCGRSDETKPSTNLSPPLSEAAPPAERAAEIRSPGTASRRTFLSGSTDGLQLTARTRAGTERVDSTPKTPSALIQEGAEGGNSHHQIGLTHREDSSVSRGPLMMSPRAVVTTGVHNAELPRSTSSSRASSRSLSMPSGSGLDGCIRDGPSIPRPDVVAPTQTDWPRKQFGFACVRHNASQFGDPHMSVPSASAVVLPSKAESTLRSNARRSSTSGVNERANLGQAPPFKHCSPWTGSGVAAPSDGRVTWGFVLGPAGSGLPRTEEALQSTEVDGEGTRGESASSVIASMQLAQTEEIPFITGTFPERIQGQANPAGGGKLLTNTTPRSKQCLQKCGVMRRHTCAPRGNVFGHALGRGAERPCSAVAEDAVRGNTRQKRGRQRQRATRTVLNSQARGERPEGGNRRASSLPKDASNELDHQHKHGRAEPRHLRRSPIHGESLPLDMAGYNAREILDAETFLQSQQQVHAGLHNLEGVHARAPVR